MAANADAMKKFRTVLDLIDDEVHTPEVHIQPRAQITVDIQVLLMMDGDPKNYDLTVDQAFNLLKLQQYFLRKVNFRWGLLFSGSGYHLTPFQAINKYVVPMQRSMVFTTDPSPATAKEETLDFSWLE